MADIASGLSSFAVAEAPAREPAPDRLRAVWLRACRQPELIALAVIVLLGVLLRAYFLARYRPALVGYPDSANYIISAHRGVFGDPQRVAGYVIFLRILHAISAHLTLVTVAQHTLGLASGLLLWDAARRAGLNRWAALVPAAVVVLGGSELLLEHSILTEALFIFLVDLGLWCLIRTWLGSGWWGLAAGAGFGAATLVRTNGLELLPFMVAALAIASPGTRLERVDRARRVLVGVAGAVAVMVPFLAAHDAQTGTWGFTTTGNLSLYGRVGPWADCAKFSPPAGTRRLCIHTPVSQRLGSQAWEFIRSSPAVQVYGPRPHPGENSQLQSFAVAAIEGQPLDYLEYVGRDLLRIVDPSYSSSPYPQIGNAGAGYGPQVTVGLLFDPVRTRVTERFMRRYYAAPGVLAGDVSLLRAWERDTRLEGPAMVLMLLLALAGCLLARGLPRRFAVLCMLAGAILAAGPVFVLEYSYRYTVPAFGALSAAAAVGGWQLAQRLGPGIARLRSGTGLRGRGNRVEN